MEKKGHHNKPRRFLRIDVALQIKFNCIKDLEGMIKASTLNVSKGGMFICTNKPTKQGRRVKIEMPGLNSRPMIIEGTIIHVRYMDGEPFGFGIEFDELKGHALELIEDLLKRTENTVPLPQDKPSS